VIVSASEVRKWSRLVDVIEKRIAKTEGSWAALNVELQALRAELKIAKEQLAKARHGES
jgi:hypothetical protein